MRINKTIASKREEVILESTRIKEEKRRKRKKVMRFVGLSTALALGTAGLTLGAVSLINRGGAKKAEVKPTVINLTSSVEIVDESGNKNLITDKIKQYVALLEKDLKDLGVKMTKVVLPMDKTRQLDVYIEGRNEYYKCLIDRSPAESAEDIERMQRYLIANNLSPIYADVRIESRAYYK